MSRPTALVTGGCGFVGRRFVRWLVKHGYDVTIVDDLSTGLPPGKWPFHLLIDQTPGNPVFHRCDFRDYARNESANFDLIVHLAAVVGGRMTIEGDPLAVATDLAIDATFFNWVVKARSLPSKVIFFSSSAAYPISRQTPESNEPLHERLISFQGNLEVPDLTYGWAKLTGEFLARFAAQQYGLNVVIYRPFSGYGEDQDFAYPFPSIIRRVARKESPVVVWGSGNQLRDFIYIEDIVNAVFASCWKLAPGEALNLGSGVGTTFREISQTACSVIGHDAEIVNDTSKPEGVFARVGDCSRMLKYYVPAVSLEDGIRLAYHYQTRAGLI